MILETVDISDISQDPANVRKHSERNLDSIAASLRAFGQQKPIVVDKRGVILAGNGTYEAAKRIGWDKIKITRTDLSGTLATAYAIADNRTAELAEWDDVALAETLRALQSEEFDVEATGFTDDEIDGLIKGLADDLVGSGNANESKGVYTNKIVAPVYEPKGENPPVGELIDRTKADELISEINDSGLPDPVKQFLRDAAERHVVFHFRNIAEFYCHASKDLQDLMEKSGLVIIDFNKAIQNGFVYLTDRLSEIADTELLGCENGSE